ncbi:MAG TPA: hypothetical protein VFM75_00415 [Modicisalibacter sp.]|nr:hypothetical protein [Modicisalibacter sp.]
MVTQRPDDDRSDQKIEPGDEAQPGTPGTGEDICRRCEGTGRIADEDCPECGGSGYVIRGIGGA